MAVVVADSIHHITSHQGVEGVACSYMTITVGVRFLTFVTPILACVVPFALGAHVCAHRALRQPCR